MIQWSSHVIKYCIILSYNNDPGNALGSCTTLRIGTTDINLCHIQEFHVNRQPLILGVLINQL